MKITIQDEDLTVSIDNHFKVTTATEARDLCVSALLAMTYHPESLASVFPTEEDVDDAILEGVKESLEYAAGSI
tara:strand:- start:207 stop:428 length:222 start_codon:yes stop_codon:yes gene_type:complete